MAYQISEDCARCDVCLAECPTGAISDGSDVQSDIYYVHQELCNECAGFDEPKCAAVCPLECITLA